MTEMALPCIVCGKQLQNEFETATNQPRDGCAFQSHGHYGSTVWDPMDGRFLEFNVCDECLHAAGEDGKVLLGQSHRLVAMPTEGGVPSVVGSTPVKRELVPWKPGYDESDEQPLTVDSVDELESLRETGFRLETQFTDEQLREMTE